MCPNQSPTPNNIQGCRNLMFPGPGRWKGPTWFHYLHMAYAQIKSLWNPPAPWTIIYCVCTHDVEMLLDVCILMMSKWHYLIHVRMWRALQEVLIVVSQMSSSG